ncbi:hypothetical protein KC19_3G011300 [Ceratodon purpureus]|uniref:Uncharacterized protein n=1 Tax=Ceratodon purpureus TaxID=3225 RepID=A0A8T0IFZ5_CERPU|nr:hypothetical protein KC19_3G011300 [Ceratodon purpureus]
MSLYSCVLFLLFVEGFCRWSVRNQCNGIWSSCVSVQLVRRFFPE